MILTGFEQEQVVLLRLFLVFVLLSSITVSEGKFETRGLSTQLYSILSSSLMKGTFSGAVTSFVGDDVIRRKRSSTWNWAPRLILEQIEWLTLIFLSWKYHQNAVESWSIFWIHRWRSCVIVQSPVSSCLQQPSLSSTWTSVVSICLMIKLLSWIALPVCWKL